MHVTRLNAAHATAYRQLMLEAYERAADAFTSTAEERAREPLAWWERRMAAADGQSEAFGAFTGDTLFGTVALEFSEKPKTRHSALIIGMYVRPGQRQQGVARALMQAAIASARERPYLHTLRLTFTEGNVAAQRLYTSLGFKAWGTEPDAILTPSGYKGKVHMNLPLARTDGRD